MEERQVLAAASFAAQKYFLDPVCSTLPKMVQEELQILCVTLAQKLCCTVVLTFAPTGDICFTFQDSENPLNFDQIGAELEMKQVKREKAELLKTCKLWYLIQFTKEGKEYLAQIEKE